MQNSSRWGNPGTTASSGNVIVIYDRAFNNPFFVTGRVVTHELGHVVLLNISSVDRKNYESTMGWLPNKQNSDRSYINKGAEENADEDFANNIDYFLFEPQSLKQTVPKAYNWIVKYFSKNFKLKEDCKHETSK